MTDYEENAQLKNLPLVVLVGRPNVGKSTLFNRLTRSRKAITDPTPGVTRDPIEQTCYLNGQPLRLVDTGGFKLDKEVLDDLVVEKTKETIERADLIVLVMEADDPTMEDEIFIEYLRPYGKKIIVAVNKTEGGRRQGDAYNLMSYGFNEMYMVSAEHGDNIQDLAAGIVARLDFSKVSSEPREYRDIRVALLGKPNTGKSTLSNRLTNSNASIVSDIPGTTRDVIEGTFEYKKRQFCILDTAGIRRKNKVRENIEYYSVNRAIRSIQDADIVFLMIDAQEGLSDQDKKISKLAHDQGRGIVFILNKWDTMPKVKNTFEAVRDRIHFLFGQMEWAPIIPVSATEGEGLDVLLDTAIRMYNQLQKKTDTATLNAALERWFQENPPPIAPKTHFKIRYATQLGVNPVGFAFFASRPQAVTEAWVSFLKNKIRKDLGYSLIPIKIEMRPSRSSYEEHKKTRNSRPQQSKQGPSSRQAGSPSRSKGRHGK